MKQTGFDFSSKPEPKTARQHSDKLFDMISVNTKTGAVAFPSIDGFELDKEQMLRSAKLFAAFCNEEMAFRHAIHQQVVAFLGLSGLTRKLR